jgi:hypothetical protein
MLMPLRKSVGANAMLLVARIVQCERLRSFAALPAGQDDSRANERDQQPSNHNQTANL